MRGTVDRMIIGSRLLANAAGLLLSHPEFLAPLLTSWSIYALLGLYLAFLHPWEAMGPVVRLLTGLGAAFVVTLTLTAVSHISLELVQQLERDQQPSLARAIWDMLRWNLLQSLLIVLIWTPLWFLFTVIDLALGEEEEGDQADERMISAATSLLAGNLRSFSFSRAFLRVFTKALRMLVFLILPSIAWEDRTAVQAARRGLGVLQAHLPEFSTGLITSELIAFSIFLPVILFFSLVESLELSLPGNGIPIGIIFLTLAWSLIFYVEQVFAALLYTWHLSWEAAHESQSKNYGGPPSLHDIPMPSLLDGVPEFD